MSGTRAGHRSRREKLKALGLSLVLSLLFGELFVRVLVGRPRAERLPTLEIRAHPTRGWAMVPDDLHYTYQHPVHVNAHGLRGLAVRAKEARELRVLALGDSLVYGQGVGDDETLPAYLERALELGGDQGGRSWSVVNAGHRAYDTRQSLALLAELGPVLQPDFVVLFWYWNDLIGRDIERTYRHLDRVGPVAFDTGTRIEGGEAVRWRAVQILRHSALAMFVHDFLKADKELASIAPLDAEEGFQRLAAYLADLRESAAELDFEAFVAIVPDPNAIAGEHQSERLTERAGQLAIAAGLPVIWLVEPLRELYREEGRLPVIPFDGHYLPQANRVMAERVARRIGEGR